MSLRFICHLLFGAMLSAWTGVLAQSPSLSGVEPIPVLGSGTRVLFQGDSITDGNRGRSEDPNHILGHGYVFIIASKYGAAFPERDLTFLNRGVSGNKVADAGSIAGSAIRSPARAANTS